ncbi:PIG-L family deacetylase [Verrucomicrobia bacterium]|nr:PIG-L family deacetylase [Verrucomicrobiota bacterium]MDB4664906.1 PIG-L family deacetylase [Verrucomicrobiota bacterium]MDG1890605.1 PIG-L family deacetylase [Verrucomicrobiota bacterium]
MTGKGAQLQGEVLLKVDILGVFAHPDDETGMAPTLAHYALGENKNILHAYCTRGEGGGNMVGIQYGASLGLLRELELRDCLTQLGVRHWYFLEQLDFAYTESIWATLARWDKQDILEKLVRIIRNHRPEVMLTMSPEPRPGQHGHHQAAGALATEAARLAAEPDAFPAHMRREGLRTWQVRKLYYLGAMGDYQAHISSSDVLQGGLNAGQIAGEALSHHRSQGFGRMRRTPWLQRPRTFSLVRSVVPFEGHETDLFRGLDQIPDAPNPPLASVPKVQPQSELGLKLHFVARPAMERYQRWVMEQGIEHVSRTFEADLPVVAGEWNDVSLEMKNGAKSARRGHLHLTVPAGWDAEPQDVAFDLNSHDELAVAVRVRPPADRLKDGAITMLAVTEIGSVTRVSANLHPLPSHRVARMPAGDRAWDSPFWNRIRSLSILPQHRVQGHSESPDDSSASVRIAYDQTFLYVRVEVRDDRVVSNIGPNDIRGHWRSDALEVCIDPRAGSEDSFSTYKLGIFPFDSTGSVRAARDADAHPGPVEETAPATKLFSMRVKGGYLVYVEIPLIEIGEGLGLGSRLGFNVIIYDGDKVEALLGENINESRLAWAPRAGVQGRPEDWGRIDLE